MFFFNKYVFSKFNNIINVWIPSHSFLIVEIFISSTVFAFPTWAFTKVPYVVISIFVLATDITVDKIHLILQLLNLKVFLLELCLLKCMLMLKLLYLKGLFVKLEILLLHFFMHLQNLWHDVRNAVVIFLVFPQINLFASQTFHLMLFTDEFMCFLIFMLKNDRTLSTGVFSFWTFLNMFGLLFLLEYELTFVACFILFETDCFVMRLVFSLVDGCTLATLDEKVVAGFEVLVAFIFCFDCFSTVQRTCDFLLNTQWSMLLQLIIGEFNIAVALHDQIA